jgi:Fic family protein
LLQLMGDLERRIGRFEGLKAPPPQPRLRKDNRVRTVQGTASLEGNRLSLDQVTALLEGRRVIGPSGEILEIRNALAAYEQAPRFRPWSEKDLLAAHKLMMHGLIADAGSWRAGNVGVLQGTRVAHVAPPAARVPRLMSDLMGWIKADATPMLIKSCVAHYELQFIHPFTDGNGRLGRLWQHVMLLRVSPLFEFAPVESLIKARQGDYYDTLGRSDRAGDCTVFLEFSLRTLRDALNELLDALRPGPETGAIRLELAREAFGGGWFSRRGYLELHKKLSSATASRDLRQGVESGALVRRGERRLAEYRFREATPRRLPTGVV